MGTLKRQLLLQKTVLICTSGASYNCLNMKNLHWNRRTQFQIFPCLGIFRQSPKHIGDGYITNFYSMQSLGASSFKKRHGL
ncbi:hypothetical protein DPEC_G00069740 [Dallia pectoralis]|uniref:Uncharacterized protein n=1 Tax=Dallia pectoralis TaxID=75939 RepID=A0ACC2H1S9_DALPE|nr:hypothetical protein DPEC_G00069740 [Dallia pectoralis]